MNTDTNRLSDPMQTTGSIRLPFPVLTVEWFNGKTGVDPEKYPVSHFGGWYIQPKNKFTTAEKILEEMGKEMIPYFPLVKMSGEKGEFEAYASRTITVCPVIKRTRWFTDEDTGKEYSVTQILSWVSVPNPKTHTFEPWGPVILKAKSLSGLALTNALYNLGLKVKPYVTDTQPAWAHWVTLGTVRAKVYTEERGKGKNTRLATPCEFYWVEDKPEAFVNGRFVGAELLQKYGEARAMAQDWADSWNTRFNQKRAGTVIEEADDGGMQPPDNYNDADQVPF